MPSFPVSVPEELKTVTLAFIERHGGASQLFQFMIKAYAKAEEAKAEPATMSALALQIAEERVNLLALEEKAVKERHALARDNLSVLRAHQAENAPAKPAMEELARQLASVQAPRSIVNERAARFGYNADELYTAVCAARRNPALRAARGV